MRCDRCHQEKEGVEFFGHKRGISLDTENRLREHLEVEGHTVATHPKLCRDCQAILRLMGLLG